MAGLFTHGYALVIGIGAYRHLRGLARTATDARDLNAVLVDPDRCGYPRAQVALLVDEQATKAVISTLR